MPRPASSTSASRTGVGLTPKRSARRWTTRREPEGKSAFEDFGEDALGDLVAQAGAGDAIFGDILYWFVDHSVPFRERSIFARVIVLPRDTASHGEEEFIFATDEKPMHTDEKGEFCFICFN